MPLGIPESRDIIIRHVAAVLQQHYPGISRVDATAQSTARRAIQLAWQRQRGWDTGAPIFTGGSRAAFNTRQLERAEWQAFVANNPHWATNFSDNQQTIIRYNYLFAKQTPDGEKWYSQAEIGKLIDLDYSRVSRSIDQLNQMRFRIATSCHAEQTKQD